MISVQFTIMYAGRCNVHTMYLERLPKVQ